MRLIKWAGVAILAVTIGCGIVGDKDRIRVAKYDDKYITRGDLFRILRELPDEERPDIRNKGDLLRVLNNYIDDQIKGPISDEVSAQYDAQKKVLVPRELAMQKFFEMYKDYDYQTVYQIKDPAAIDMSPAQHEAVKTELDLRIDKLHNKLKGDRAIEARAIEDFNAQKFEISQTQYEREYKLRKDELKKLEWMKFRAIRFMADFPGSEAEAAAVRKRLDSGESFDSLVDDYLARNSAYVIESEIENNPLLEKFRGFWLNASECQKGDIIGPVYLPQYQIMAMDAQGRPSVQNMPDAYLVLQVLEHKPETILTLDESKRLLLPHILVSRFMEKLRSDHGVEVYENKLPDPAIFSKEFGDRPLR